MPEELRARLKELSAQLGSRASHIHPAGDQNDLAVLMSGVAGILDALLVISEEVKTPRSGPSIDPDMESVD
jgi:hypothetical protein